MKDQNPQTPTIDTTNGTMSSIAVRKVYEAVGVLQETQKTPITVADITNLIGQEFSDPHWVGRAVSLMCRATPRPMTAEHASGGKHGPLTNIKVVGPLAKFITVKFNGDGKRRVKKSAAPPAQEALPLAEAKVAPVSFNDVLLSLVSMSRRELLLLSIQVNAQLKETQS